MRESFKELLPSVTIIWIQLCHYSPLLSVSEGLLNTLMIRLQNELPFSRSISLLHSLPHLRSHTRSLLIQEIRFLPSRQVEPHLTFDLTL